MTKIIYKKRTRLKDFDYRGYYRYFLTLCTSHKTPILGDASIVEWLTNVLVDKSKHHGFKIWAYCFMPDHLHLLIEGTTANSDMRRFISGYKQLTGFSLKKKIGQSLWQMNYFDHVLRKEEDTLNVTRYILNNPVRRGLVDDYKDYKHLGSFEVDVKEM